MTAHARVVHYIQNLRLMVPKHTPSKHLNYQHVSIRTKQGHGTRKNASQTNVPVVPRNCWEMENAKTAQITRKDLQIAKDVKLINAHLIGNFLLMELVKNVRSLRGLVMMDKVVRLSRVRVINVRQ